MLKERFTENISLLDAKINAVFSNIKDSQLKEAMLYSLNNGGKRIRPFLVIEVARAFGEVNDDVITCALAVELIHTFSLIHDDLPALDNDDERRGKPTSHKKFDEATAILAGDALYNLAFEIIPEKYTKIIATACGANGLIGGQMMDLYNPPECVRDIDEIHSLKTGALFDACCKLGLLEAGKDKDVLKKFVYYFGILFQITDDILDANEGDVSSELNYVNLIGMKNTNLRCEEIYKLALAELGNFNAPILEELVTYIYNRDV